MAVFAKVSFKRIGKHECQRCGLCCQGSGDLLGPPEDGEEESDDCSAFDSEIGCTCYPDRRDFCKEYPGDEWCQRELKEKGLWEQYKGD